MSEQGAGMIQATMGIIVGGGPAPGINGVIGSAAIEAINNGLRVIGFYNGFRHLSSEKFDRTEHSAELKITDMSRVHFTGGSLLKTARTSLLDTSSIDEEGPVRPDPAKVGQVAKHLKELHVSHLLTIGGDDTALSARFVADHCGGDMRVVHVPKTIDNDLPLPGDVPTFGFTTARHLGSTTVANLMEDAKTTSRWYIVVTMGRNAGFLAQGIGKAAGATLTLIPEEFPAHTSITEVCDVIEGSILKRRTMGRHHGVVVAAEGLVYKLGKHEELAKLLGKEVPLDDAGHIRLSEVPFAQILKNELTGRFATREEKIRILGHTLGYELRCAAPTTFDLSYTRDLGHGGVRLLLDSKEDLPAGVMVTLQDGNLVPVPFESMIDPVSNRTRIRMVDMNSYSYSVARAYMIRLESSDFESPTMLAALAREAKMTQHKFRERYERVAKGPHRDTSERHPAAVPLPDGVDGVPVVTC